MTVLHRPGKKHQNADALSRIPESDNFCENYRLGGLLPDSLPCGGCSYCRKAHINWSHFVDVVDEVIPLASGAKQVAGVTVSDSYGPEYGVTHMDLLSMDDDCIVCINGVTVDAPGISLASEEELTSSALFKREQEADGQLTILHKWLTSQEEPDEGTIMLLDPASKFLWINRDLFILQDGLIRRKSDDHAMLVVPRSLQREVIRLNHDIPSAGHAGIDRTLSKIKARYFWYCLTRDVKDYIRTCAVCNQKKKKLVGMGNILCAIIMQGHRWSVSISISSVLFPRLLKGMNVFS